MFSVFFGFFPEEVLFGGGDAGLGVDGPTVAELGDFKRLFLWHGVSFPGKGSPTV